MDPYGSHQRALVAAVCRTVGPVIEFGCGDYSTPILHEMCGAAGRKLLSLESDPEWLARFTAMRTPEHEIRLVTSWDDVDLGGPWAVAFVDHAPAARRVVDIERVRSRAQFIVVHDTEDPTYGYEPLLSSFRYRIDLREIGPHTKIVGDFKPLL
jgi:hypothetical protein